MSKLKAGLSALKNVGVKTNITIHGGPWGANIASVSGRKPNAFYKPKRTGTRTSIRPDGDIRSSSTITEPGRLTPLGRRTAQGAAIGGAGAAGGAAIYNDRKKRVAKMALPGKKPIGYIRPLNFPDATGQRGPTGGKHKGDQKDISKSIWGVDHAEPVHKAFSDKTKQRAKVAGVNAAGLGGAAAGLYGASKIPAIRRSGGIGGSMRNTAAAIGAGTAGGIAGDRAAFRASYPGEKRSSRQGTFLRKTTGK